MTKKERRKKKLMKKYFKKWYKKVFGERDRIRKLLTVRFE